MNRLQAELQRLYLPLGSDGPVRAMVLELARPASWDGLAKVWRGVQADLELPAPAIAVSGADGYQLWFSSLEPVPVAQAKAFLESLRRRYLGGIAQQRVGMRPGVDAMPTPIERAPGRWSAFVAPDLAAVFGDEPWLDLPPGPDAQADLLSRLESTKPDDWQRALARLGPADPTGVTPTPQAADASSLHPRQFLLGIMNDQSIDLQLRIEAARALLPYFDRERPL